MTSRAHGDACHANLGLIAVVLQAVQAGREQELRVAFSRPKVAASASLSEVFPLNDRQRAAFGSWRRFCMIILADVRNNLVKHAEPSS